MNEKTSPRILKISGRVNLLLRKIPKRGSLADLASFDPEIAEAITVGDLVSMAQSLNTQAANREEKKGKK